MPADRFVWLRHDREDVMLMRTQQMIQSGQADVAGADEKYPHACPPMIARRMSNVTFTGVCCASISWIKSGP